MNGKLAWIAFGVTMSALAPPVQAAESCPRMVWTTLGTAGGPVPTVERSEPANMLFAGSQTILVDTGDGTVDQMAKAGVVLGQVSSVFLSHHHLDHTGGLGAVIGLRWMNQFPGKLTVYGPPGTREIVDGIVASMGPPSRIGFGLGVAPPDPRGSVEVVELAGGQKMRVGEVNVTAVANTHYDHDGDAGAGSALSFSYRFDFGNRSITYSGDTGPSEALTKLAEGSDLLVTEVMDLDRLLAEIELRRRDASPKMLAAMREHLSTHHLPAAEVGKIAAKARVKRVVLTHYALPDPLVASGPYLRGGVGTSFSGTVDLARDLSSFAVGC